MSIRTTSIVAAFALATSFAVPGLAASPSLREVLPRGGQRGAEMELSFRGDRLDGAAEVFLYDQGITVKEVKPVGPNEAKVKVQIAPDVRLGEYPLRLRTSTGITELQTFYVGALPVIEEKEPNTQFTQPQSIQLNHTVTGIIENEDVDHFVVEAKKGQRLTAEIESVRLGEAFVDPYVAILNPDRFELAASDDTALLLQDSIASIVVPEDGKYVIQVRESSYGGAGNGRYRLHVGTFPRPRGVYPPGGKVGDDVHVQFVGDVTGPLGQSMRLPAEPKDRWPVFAEQGGEIAPSPNYVRVCEFANVLEAEPNNTAAQGTKAPGELPLAFNGVVGEKEDYDWFRFTAKAGQAFGIHVYARRLRSPLDPVITLASAEGKDIARNDDSGNPDSFLRWNVPADGEYTICVTDHLRQGGPDYAYRVEIVPIKPALTLSIPAAGPNASQERQMISVPRGNRFGTLVRATRADFGGEVTLEATNLPEGVTVACENVAANTDVVPVIFEAKPDAPIGGRLADLSAKAADPNVKVKGVFRQTIDLLTGPNNVPYYQVTVDRLAVAAVEEVPFKVELVQPKVPLVQNGSKQLKVKVERQPGFTGAVNVRMLFDPPGTGHGPITIPGDQSEGLLTVNANGDAPTRKWKVAVLAQSEAPAVPEKKSADGKTVEQPARPASGPIWVSSQLAELEVATPMVLAKVEMAAAEQGKSVPMVVNLDHKAPFEGEAVIRLLNLPPNASAPEQKVKAGDAKVTFEVQTGAKTPPGQHNAVFCQLVVTKEGEPIVHNIGQGGVLRVDVPPPPKADAPPKPAEAAAKPAQPTEKPLSRLEQLRQQKK